MGNLATLPTKQVTTLQTVPQIEVTKQLIRTWKVPPFQRFLRITEKVRECIEVTRTTGKIPGVIYLGRYKGVLYLIDGQHRLEAFRLSELPSALAHVLIEDFTDMAEMGKRYVELCSSLVKVRADDRMHALEATHPVLQTVRTKCPFLSYGHGQLAVQKMTISASTAIRAWMSSQPETPSPRSFNVALMLKGLQSEGASGIIGFLTACHEAWSTDYPRLWGALNLTLCAYIYRRTVLDPDGKTPLTRGQFIQGMQGLSTNQRYQEWLLNRQLGSIHRAPAYKQIKITVQHHLKTIYGGVIRLPKPIWMGSIASSVDTAAALQATGGGVK